MDDNTALALFLIMLILVVVMLTVVFVDRATHPREWQSGFMLLCKEMGYQEVEYYQGKAACIKTVEGQKIIYVPKGVK